MSIMTNFGNIQKRILIFRIQNINTKIMEEETSLTVHAYDWVIRDKYNDNDHLAIHCWALDKDSKPYLLRIVDFPCFCYIELPMFVRNRNYEWSNSSVS